MSTIQRIEKKGYKVRLNLGYRNGQITTVSVTAIRGSYEITRRSATQVLKSI
jgi:hypothetical protein